MTQQERQVLAEKLRRSSEYIKAAESFAEYAHKEWVEGNADERALLMCCIDRTTSDGTGALNVVAGDKDLITVAVMEMMKDDDLGEVFRKARIVSETSDDIYDSIQSALRRLRSLYGFAALSACWTMCIIVFQICGITNWITTTSNLLLMAFVGVAVGRDIMERRRMLKRLKRAVRRDRDEQMKHLEQTVFDALRKRMGEDEED